MTARTICGWLKFRECGELLYGRRFPLNLKGTVHKSYVRPVILHESETWYLRESKIRIFRKGRDSW